MTVIELKDENKPAETFSKAIKQAIAYAVFIRELARGEAGADWMELWGMQNQPWKDSLTIKAAAAMPKGKNDDLSFAEPPTQIRLDQDIIELHYIATTTAVGSQTQTVEFETSL